MTAALSWKVTNQVTGQTINDDAGNTIVGSYIYFVTGRGNKGSVFLSDAVLSTDTATDSVRQACRKAARMLDDIGMLSE